jgi:hypothetical protein
MRQSFLKCIFRISLSTFLDTYLASASSNHEFQDFTVTMKGSYQPLIVLYTEVHIRPVNKGRTLALAT